MADKGKHLIRILLLLLVLNSGIMAQETSLKDGESATYIAAYNWGPVWVDAGEVTFSSEKTGYKGSPAFHLKCSGRTYKAYDLFFKIRDYYDSWIDPATFRSLEFKRQIYESGYTMFNNIHFYPKAGYLLSNTKVGKKPIKTDTLRFRPGVYDMLSAIYYTRTLDLSGMPDNHIVPVPVVIDDSVYVIRLKKLGKEIKANRDGTKYPCIKLSVSLIEGTIFKKDEEAIVWLTDDVNKIPIIVEAHILVGTVIAYLSRVTGLAAPLKTVK